MNSGSVKSHTDNDIKCSLCQEPTIWGNLCSGTAFCVECIIIANDKINSKKKESFQKSFKPHSEKATNCFSSNGYSNGTFNGTSNGTSKGTFNETSSNGKSANTKPVDPLITNKPKMCHKGSDCTWKGCKFLHNMPDGKQSIGCNFGTKCTNWKKGTCTYFHSKPYVSTSGSSNGNDSD